MTDRNEANAANIRAQIEAAVAEKDLSALIALIPYARLLGIDYYAMGNEYIYRLPQNDNNLGNPSLPALHGGVIGGFMETSGILQVMMAAESLVVPKVVDFSLDYLSPGRNRDTFAKCIVVRQGKKIANVAITAWQTQADKPIARARAHFLIV